MRSSQSATGTVPRPVIFGDKGDASLVGALTLDALGLMVDPLRRELRPLPMLLV
jgi:hypothetical protein